MRRGTGQPVTSLLMRAHRQQLLTHRPALGPIRMPAQPGLKRISIARVEDRSPGAPPLVIQTQLDRELVLVFPELLAFTKPFRDGLEPGKKPDRLRTDSAYVLAIPRNPLRWHSASPGPGRPPDMLPDILAQNAKLFEAPDTGCSAGNLVLYGRIRPQSGRARDHHASFFDLMGELHCPVQEAAGLSQNSQTAPIRNVKFGQNAFPEVAAMKPKFPGRFRLGKSRSYHG